METSVQLFTSTATILLPREPAVGISYGEHGKQISYLFYINLKSFTR